MRENPLLMNGPMVRAVLAGNKTQTRRIAKNVVDVHARTGEPLAGLDSAGPRVPCPYGQVGDLLWVRETWAPDPPADGTWAYTSWAGCKGSKLMDIPERYRTPDHCMFAADYPLDAKRWVWKPSIHMPRWACRILLEVTGVRVERLQDISNADCWAEGIEEVDGTLDPLKICELAKRMGRCIDDPSPTFAALWESISGPGSWDANPWVWVIEFRRIT
ncbi:PmgT [Herbaspirillum sp. DW155]|uniref:hypothetical protein n=1 Tax=Herbaspirillum sp. DW155 TaxID=3095609 RepID=UPI0030856B01|nr:PmgT [Herbaspirillum sp. DW155]